MGLKLQIVGIVSSLLIVTAGLGVIVFGNGIIHSFLSSNVKLVPDSDFYKTWKDPPIKAYLSFHIFDLKNGEEFLNGDKPALDEIGPFVFEEFLVKDNVVNNMNFTISYTERKYYKFVPELSAQNLTYEITTVNLAPLVLIDKLKHQNQILLDLLNGVLDAVNETLLVTKPVEQLLFGYEDTILKDVKEIPILGDFVPSAQVGLFIGKNNTLDGQYTIYTAEDDASKLGVIERFNFERSLSLWHGKYGNMINGTDGTLYPPFIDKSKRLYIFNSDICRSIYLNYAETITIKDDIEVIGFKPELEFFADPVVNKDNEAFCTDSCMPAGVLNLTECVGAPLIMSNPHFLWADPKYLKLVDGMSPNETEHLTSIYIHQETGIPMKANKKVQFNIQIEKNDLFTMTENLPKLTLYPLFWGDENFVIDQASADKFKNQVLLPLLVVNVGKYVLAIGGGFLLIVSLAYTVIAMRKVSEQSDSDTSDELLNGSAERIY